MAKEFRFNILDILGVIEEKPNSDWGTAVTRISWNDKAPVYDIRKYDITTIDTDEVVMGKGVSIENDESMDNLVMLLLNNGFGDTDDILDILEKRESIFDNFNDDFVDESENKKKKCRRLRFKRLRR